MNVLGDPSQVLATLCRYTLKWGVYISFYPENLSDEIISKVAPYLNDKKFLDIRLIGHGYILLDTRKEMLSLYDRTIGDDGTKDEESFRVYALTCDPNGTLLTENT